MKSRLCLILHAGDFGRVYYALALASAALASNRPVTLFFTMGASRALAAGGPGWHHLLPGEDGLPPAQADESLRQKGLAGFEELLSAVILLGASIMVCEMGLRAMGLEAQALRTDVTVIPGGLVSFLETAEAGDSVIFI